MSKEYKFLQQSDSYDLDEIERTMSKMSEEGWRIENYQVIPFQPGGPFNHCVILSRPVIDKK